MLIETEELWAIQAYVTFQSFKYEPLVELMLIRQKAEPQQEYVSKADIKSINQPESLPGSFCFRAEWVHLC